MSQEEMLKIMATITLASYTLVELIKPYVVMFLNPFNELEDNTKAAIYQLFNIAFCILGVLLAGPQVNLLVLNEQLSYVHPLVGQIFTGVALGFGPKFLNIAMSFLTLRLVTIPTINAMAKKADALRVLSSVPSNVGELENQIRAEKV